MTPVTMETRDENRLKSIRERKNPTVFVNGVFPPQVNVKDRVNGSL